MIAGAVGIIIGFIWPKKKKNQESEKSKESGADSGEN